MEHSTKEIKQSPQEEPRFPLKETATKKRPAMEMGQNFASPAIYAAPKY